VLTLILNDICGVRPPVFVLTPEHSCMHGIDDIMYLPSGGVSETDRWRFQRKFRDQDTVSAQ